MRRWVLLLATVVVLVLPVDAAARSSCRSQVGHGAHDVQQSPKAAVYWRKEKPPHSTPHRVYYACDRQTATLRRLIGFEDFHYRVHHLALAGHVVAFSFSDPDPAAQETVYMVRVHDLRTDSHRTLDALSDDASRPGRSEYVRSLVLKPNASVAWVASFRPDEGAAEYTHQVNAVEAGRGNRRTKLDEGAAIGPRSLALSADGKTLYWTHAGAPRSARLR